MLRFHPVFRPVDLRGVEPPASSLQMKRSTGELQARNLRSKFKDQSAKVQVKNQNNTFDF